ncbi:MAG: arginine--tRNA ligase [Acidimicrobiales bacterium]
MIRDELLNAVFAALGSLGVDEVPDGVVIERPARPEHGDWSTNAALVCAKVVGTNPRSLAQRLVDELSANPPRHVDEFEIAGPGFVNFRLAPTWLHEVLTEVVTEGPDAYARMDQGAGRTVNIEFVSANPTGPLHAGHGRWAAYGDSVARILERVGWDVHREFYINDRGVQAEQYARSLVARRNGEEPADDGYRGEYIAEWAALMPADADPLEWGLAHARAHQEASLSAMHVEFDSWSSERDLVQTGAIEATLDELREGGHVYDDEDAVWLRTTDFGDDKDRVLVKADGEPTYFLPDIAYHRDKFGRGALLVDILGADHHGYVARMKAALLALGHSSDEYEAIIGQNVTLIRDGAEVRLSKRAGTMVLLADLVDEVGPDVARFAYLLQSIDTRQTIDIDVLKAHASENPVFYVQYAHARIHAIVRMAEERSVERRPLAEVDLARLSHERELALLRSLSALPEVLLIAAAERAPHKMTTWIRELASDFHGFYRDCPVLSDDDDDLRQARLWLVEAARIGLSIGLDILGVSAPEEM